MAALTELQTSLRAVRAVVAIEGKYPDPPPPQDRAACFALRGACIVLTVACFEAFLRAVFEEELDRIASEGLPLSRYPDRLRTAAIYASLDHGMKGDHTTCSLPKEQRLDDVLAAAKLVAADSFQPRALALTESNPDGNCVVRMFKAIGCSEVFKDLTVIFEQDWGQPVAVSFCRDKLDELLRSRHQVAHTADAAHITRREIGEDVRFIETFAGAIARRLSKHVGDIIAAARVT